ncbi:MAG: phosphocholine cytidylyltransferase family protein [Planctomycetales bacterium]|nr:phosphocholine cytidylyltransferase family protein [Planctomycetales bacterium]
MGRAVTRAVILAAGQGTRLGPAAEGRPKILLDIGGKPLLERTLETLADAGLGNVTVVVGWKAEEVRAALGRRGECVENPDYAATNSLQSLWYAREALRGGAVVLNGDTFLDPEILDRLLRAGPDALAYDSTSGSGREHMKVVLHEGRVATLGKDLPPAQAAGENVGVFVLSPNGARVLVEKADALVRAGRREAWVAEAVQATAAEVPIRGVDVAGLPWAEIDFPFDLERARNEVWPAIEKRRRRKPLRLAAAAAIGAAMVASVGFGLWSWARPAQLWESVVPEAVEKTQRTWITLPDGRQKWWSAPGGAGVEVELEGPEQVRLETRLLLAATTGEEGEKYAVEIRLDGKPVDWAVLRASPDPEAALEGARVGDRDRTDVTVPAGRHRLRVGLVAGDPRTLLVRIRRPESPR